MSEVVRVLQLTWDDPELSYGGIPTVVRGIAVHAGPSCEIVTRILPSANRLQLTAPQGERHLLLHRLRKQIAELIALGKVDLVHTHNLHPDYASGVADAGHAGRVPRPWLRLEGLLKRIRLSLRLRPIPGLH